MRFEGLLRGYDTNVEHLGMGHIDNLDGVCLCLMRDNTEFKMRLRARKYWEANHSIYDFISYKT